LPDNSSASAFSSPRSVFWGLNDGGIFRDFRRSPFLRADMQRTDPMNHEPHSDNHSPKQSGMPGVRPEEATKQQRVELESVAIVNSDMSFAEILDETNWA
jgi:hypothetical protein